MRLPVSRQAILRPLQEFLQRETAGSILLLGAAAIALTWANLPGSSYVDFWSRELGGDVGPLHLQLTLGEWVSDGLMALFFFVVGAEIKRELVRGELSGRQQAMLPAAAALGGMIAPALIFVLFNPSSPERDGWGIPMATDIAFAVGVLALLGPRVPLSLKVFLLALAIVDDLGSIAVIAIFYTDNISWAWLAVAAALFTVVAMLPRAGILNVWVYALAGFLAWFAVHESGVHATIAGVVMGLLVPVERDSDDIPASDASTAEPPLERLERAVHPWSSFLVVPLFALANAGVELGGGKIADAFASPVAWGIALGLIIGKPLGIGLASYVAVRAGIATLPSGASMRDLMAVSVVAGIGFTVALFITQLAFDDPVTIDEAKIAILLASLLMGAAGIVALRTVLPERPPEPDQ
jgi:NhaA family Na+:H+ antiporter